MADTIAKFRDIFGQIDSCSPLTDSIVQTYVSPKACGHTQGRKVVSREEAVMRIKAAVDARKESGSDIVIVARSDSHQADSMQESLWRGKDAHTKSKVLDIIHFPCLGCLSEQCRSTNKSRTSICPQINPKELVTDFASAWATPFATRGMAQQEPPPTAAKREIISSTIGLYIKIEFGKVIQELTTEESVSTLTNL
ncbi:uncharacterized protein LOC115716132 isoform X1 [Cannabis sativa]|uniref:uncharacterized protein LOC133037980 isoform X2 n=1 Tax=Cannabis sativa TaxID=3483 RepID=UPI0029CA63C2|nr:uncharacterized protein LOC133037980 isoform X2 [Cannabis sativa]XP_060971826.1 uncharacterized protein LOC115716132 isoform X1 [Cannabis sativa]